MTTTSPPERCTWCKACSQSPILGSEVFTRSGLSARAAHFRSGLITFTGFRARQSTRSRCTLIHRRCGAWVSTRSTTAACCAGSRCAMRTNYGRWTLPLWRCDADHVRESAAVRTLACLDLEVVDVAGGEHACRPRVLRWGQGERQLLELGLLLARVFLEDAEAVCSWRQRPRQLCLARLTQRRDVQPRPDPRAGGHHREGCRIGVADVEIGSEDVGISRRDLDLAVRVGVRAVPEIGGYVDVGPVPC